VLVAQIAFAEFTRDRVLRHGRFLGLREDKKAADVTTEVAEEVDAVTEGKAKSESASVAGVRLTHPDKVLYPDQGITKRDLAGYLAAVADRMLPHCADRLTSLVRCPEGSGKKCFFQRHVGAGLTKELQRMAVRSKDGGSEEYLYIHDKRGLVAAAQMGVLELHIWGSHIEDVERPDRIVFDLDPDPSVDFAAVKTAAGDIRAALDALGLESFPLLTGGKGIHVVAPILRRHEWPVVKSFAKALHRHDEQGEAQGPHLHRLSAERAQRDRDRPLFAARPQRRAARLASHLEIARRRRRRQRGHAGRRGRPPPRARPVEGLRRGAPGPDGAGAEGARVVGRRFVEDYAARRGR
jgi:bifunctional non-homologous end joining protein LigD